MCAERGGEGFGEEKEMERKRMEHTVFSNHINQTGASRFLKNSENDAEILSSAIVKKISWIRDPYSNLQSLFKFPVKIFSSYIPMGFLMIYY